MRVKTILFCGGLCFLAQQAFAETLIDIYMSSTPDEAVHLYMKEALDNIDKAKCGEVPCDKASAEEYENPPISMTEARAAMAHGGVSALASWCGIDWKRSFLPMIGYGKIHEKMTDRQLEIMSMIHGSFMARQIKTFEPTGECPDKVKQRLENELPMV